MLKQYRFLLFCLFLGLFCLFLDFYTKSYLFERWGEFENREMIFSHFLGGIDFSLVLTQNQGAAWGLFSSFPIVLLVVRIFAVIFMLCYLIFFRPKKGEVIGLLLVVAGATGNIIDFFLYGAVIDFFSFSFWGWHFAVFNLADVFVTLGVIWLGSYTLFFRKTPA